MRAGVTAALTAVLAAGRRPGPGTGTAAAVPRLARWPVGLIAGAVAAVHLVAGSLGRGYWFDEALMLALGRHHLDWGSADQPPGAPLLARLADTVAPGSIAVLRIVPSLATAAAVVVAALIARELGGDRRARLFPPLPHRRRGRPLPAPGRYRAAAARSHDRALRPLRLCGRSALPAAG